MNILFLVIGLLLGIMMGVIFMKTFIPKTCGLLKSKSDEDGTYMFLEVSDMKYIKTHDYIQLKVDPSLK